jgi:hypothetical protein
VAESISGGATLWDFTNIFDEWRPGNLLIDVLRFCGAVALVGGVLLPSSMRSQRIAAATRRTAQQRRPD